MNYANFSYEVTYQSSLSGARLGKIMTPHGVLETPSFIFCATKAAIKGLTPQQMKDAGTEIILSNTYHLMLQPGSNLVAEQGGLHQFMGWNGPMLTDSGGFQIFSLGHGSVAEEIKGKRSSKRTQSLVKITEEGAQFKSYLDGSLHCLTPEKSIQIQQDLGADLIVVLDECTPFHVDKSYTERSVHLSHRWATRSFEEFKKGKTEGKQALYGIIQGGIYPDLRKISCDFVNSTSFFGHAIGGSLGADKSQMADIVAITAENLAKSRPIHLLGIGGIRDIFFGVQQGIDTFDCVHPTRLARHGGALVPVHVWKELNENPKGREHINLRNSRFANDGNPIDKECPCQTCQTFSRAYLHHLLKARELLALQAITLHNVAFMNQLVKAIRSAIREERLDAEQKRWISND